MSSANIRPIMDAARRVDMDQDSLMKLYTAHAQRVTFFELLKQIKNGNSAMGFSEVVLESALHKAISEYMSATDPKSLTIYTGIKGTETKIQSDILTTQMHEEPTE